MTSFSFSHWPKLLSIGALFLISALSLASAAGQFPKAWMDDASGYAIGGYDPVDYFIKGKPVRPEQGIETFWGGVNWKFRNPGNKGAFLAHPATYVPRFGGADPYMLARHRAVTGNPTLFDIYQNRLYLFFSKENLAKWHNRRKLTLAEALRTWPKMADQLALDRAEVTNPERRPK